MQNLFQDSDGRRCRWKFAQLEVAQIHLAARLQLTEVCPKIQARLLIIFILILEDVLDLLLSWWFQLANVQLMV